MRRGTTDMPIPKECRTCFGADIHRQNGDKIRCRVFSEWRNPMDDCSAYLSREKVMDIVRKRAEKRKEQANG